MEAFIEYFDNVRRTALVLKHKQPFINWLKKLDDDDSEDSNATYDELLNDTDVYLLPDFDERKQMENWLKKNFDDIFADQMNHWYMDETVWVQNRTFKMFKEWFDYSLHTMVWDTQEKPITKD